MHHEILTKGIVVYTVMLLIIISIHHHNYAVLCYNDTVLTNAQKDMYNYIYGNAVSIHCIILYST